MADVTPTDEPPRSRLEQVRHILAQAQTAAIMDGLPASCPQTNERMAQAICEWMAGLPVIYLGAADAC